MKLEEMLTCQHTVRCLHAAGIDTMEQLVNMSKEELLSIRGIGKVIAADLCKAMETYAQQKRTKPWKCPKCGRSFRNEGQQHYCGKTPQTIDEYILAQDEDIRDKLQSVRKTIRAELPDATERISWAMPTWWQGHNIIHFAAQKKHIGLYPGPEAVVHFEKKLTACGCTYSKGAIQIPYSDHLPLELIAEIAAWCRDSGNHP